MAYEREGAKKVPHPAEAFLELERRLKQVQDDLRDLRTRMRDAEMESVELTLGTFLHHLGQIEPLAKRFLGKLEEQITVREVKKARENKLKQINKR